MRGYWVQPPALASALIPGALWRVPTNQRTVYLTLDDGPCPGVTEYALELLEAYQAKATFFCLGAQLHAHPALARRAQAAGHIVANHTYTHVDGWRTQLATYLAQVQATEDAVQDVLGSSTGLFRPPYGRITRRALACLQPTYRVVCWSIMPGDFDPSCSAAECAQRVIRRWKPGSIIVLHDNARHGPVMLQVLALLLQYFSHQHVLLEALPVC